MVLSKFAEATVNVENITEAQNYILDSDMRINERMKAFASELKVIAPQASDFLYFTAVMMHAAEASLINDDGSIKKHADGTPVTASWEKVGNDSIKWVCSDKNIMPYKNSNCFVAGTEVLMADGSVKNIEDVEIGDEVISHKGLVRKVTHTFINEYSGDLLNISIRNNRNIKVTPEHPFYQLKISGENDTQKHLFRKASTEKIFDFTEAKSLKKYDILTSPVINHTVKSNITEQEAWLLGVFAAEGSFGKKYGNRQEITYTFNINEYNTLAKKVAATIQDTYPSASVRLIERPDSSVCYVHATGKTNDGKKLSDYFYEKVGEYSLHKTLSTDIVFGSFAVKTQFLIGWLEGDGHVSKDWGRIIGVTVSANLANQIRLMLHSLGIYHGLYLAKTSGEKVINKNYPASLVQDSYRIEISATAGQDLINKSSYLKFTNRGSDKNQNAYFENYFIGNTVSDIVKETFSGYVYNIEVEEDHSYVANNIAVHNCDIFPESELKLAYPKWVGRPLCLDHKSSSVDMIRGVIVDTYWDEDRKRIIALCALDKKNHPDLAFKVSSGYATNVSMGTAVGRAVCTEHGCHKVARIESDFCDHMRRKSCYGEINLDLSPIELSLVVTGADPKAKVKHIIAKDMSAVRTAAAVLEDYKNGKIALASADEIEIEYIQKELAKLNDRVARLAESSTGDENEVNYGTTGSSPEMAKTIIETEQAYSAPEKNISYASEDVKGIISEALAKLSTINNNLNILSSLHNSEGTQMTEKNAYYQGTVEPVAPGQKQYPVDPTEGAARMQDKHMVGEAPFPGVGPVDGLYPEDEALKKKLQRAAQEKRDAIRRAALEQASANLESKGYYQGTEEPSAPGKVQYTPDPLEGKARKEDKQMVGAKPFPDVGPVDGIYPGDLKTKEMVARAGFAARFSLAKKPSGAIDKAASAWHVYDGDTLILRASVHDLTGGKSETLYEGVATKGYGQGIISTIKAEGLDKAKVTLKLAQEVPGLPAAAPAETPALEVAPELGDAMGDADEIKNNLRSKIDETIGELKELVSELAEGQAHTELAAGELADVTPAPEEGFKAASTSSMRRTVNGMLVDGFKDVIATIDAHIVELETAKSVLPKKFSNFGGKERVYFAKLVDSAVSDAKKTVADSSELLESFVIYAQAVSVPVPEGSVVHPGAPAAGAVDGINPFADFDSTVSDPFTDAAKTVQKRLDEADRSFVEDYLSVKDENEAKVEIPDHTPVSEVSKIEGAHVVASVDLTTKEGRAMHRAKIAQNGLKVSDILGKAHPGSGPVPGGFDTKPSGDLARVETLTEVSKAMNDLANLPPKVRKQAQEIAQLVQAGKIASNEIDQLVSLGIDADAVKYYKAYFAEARDSDSKEFAEALTSEHVKAKTAAEIESTTVRVKRAYELAYEMCDKGMINKTQIPTQVNEIMAWNDESFSSIKNIVANQSPALSKSASLPQVGFFQESGDIMLPGVGRASTTQLDLVAALEAHWAGKRTGSL